MLFSLVNSNYRSGSRVLQLVASLALLCNFTVVSVRAQDEQAGAATAVEKSYIHEVNVRMPMADGTELAADIYQPKTGGPFPTVLVRSPYGRQGLAPYVAVPLAEQGYAVVMQDVRGMGDSAGQFIPFIGEKDDGLATLDWITAQDWCDGSIGMWGASYLAYCALVLDPEQHPSLKAIFNISGWGNSHRMTAPGGAMHLMIGVPWTLSAQISGQRPNKPVDWPEAFKHLPITEIPQSLGIVVPHWEGAVGLFTSGALGEMAAVEGRYDQMHTPTFTMTGWYDFVSTDTLEIYEQVGQAQALTDGPRLQKLMVGPWHHDQQWGMETMVGDEDFGPDSAMGIERVVAETGRWFDRWLKGEANGVMDEPGVDLFVMGDNEWRNFESWPPAQTKFEKWYLSSPDGDARSSAGNGVLARLGAVETSGVEADEFVYDPMNPVPTFGGSNCHFFPEMLGILDQSETEAREDVLVYTSELLEEALTLIGPLQAVVYASTSGQHADFTAKLVEVRADGYARIIDDGIRRGPDATVMWTVEPIESGKVYRYTIELGRTAITLPAGSRLRVDISSSNFPKFSRNASTGESPESATILERATQRVFHTAEYASHVVLPVQRD